MALFITKINTTGTNFSLRLAFLHCRFFLFSMIKFNVGMFSVAQFSILQRNFLGFWVCICSEGINNFATSATNHIAQFYRIIYFVRRWEKSLITALIYISSIFQLNFGIRNKDYWLNYWFNFYFFWFRIIVSNTNLIFNSLLYNVFQQLACFFCDIWSYINTN